MGKSPPKLETAGSPKATRRLRILAGPNGSGKSTIKTVLRDSWIGYFVNADEIEKELRESGGTLDLTALGMTSDPEAALRCIRSAIEKGGFAEKLGAGFAATLTVDADMRLHVPQGSGSYVAAAVADGVRHRLLELGLSFTFETVMSHRSKIEFMRQARQRGYRVYLYYVATVDPAINIDRVHTRVLMGGHCVPDERVVERYYRSIDHLTEACEAADRAYIFDNSGTAHEWLVEVSELGTVVDVKTSSIPAWLAGTRLITELEPDESGDPEEPAQSDTDDTDET